MSTREGRVSMCCVCVCVFVFYIVKLLLSSFLKEAELTGCENDGVSKNKLKILNLRKRVKKQQDS